MTSRPKIELWLIVGGVLRILMFPAVIFVPAGTWCWPEGWAVIALYVLWASATALWLRKRDPALLSERAKASPIQADQKSWDKVFQVGFFVLGVAMIVLPGLDRRWGWTRVPVVLEVAALLVHVPAFVWIAWVMKENTFLSRVVKIDEACGHRVVTTGPYAVVRHPMYTASTSSAPVSSITRASTRTSSPTRQSSGPRLGA